MCTIPRERLSFAEIHSGEERLTGRSLEQCQFWSVWVTLSSSFRSPSNHTDENCSRSAADGREALETSCRPRRVPVPLPMLLSRHWNCGPPFPMRSQLSTRPPPVAIEVSNPHLWHSPGSLLAMGGHGSLAVSWRWCFVPPAIGRLSSPFPSSPTGCTWHSTCFRVGERSERSF